MPDTTPILDPDYDFRTSCTKDDAVQYLMGRLRGGPLKPNFLSDYDRHHRDESDYEPSLSHILISMRDSAEAGYSNAVYENLAQNVIDDKLAELQRCDLEINQAHQYKCLITDELAKGDKSALRIDHNTTINPEYPFITLASLNQWAKEHKIKVLDLQVEQNELQDAGSQKGGLSKTKASNLQITFALLVKAFAETGPKFLKSNDAPNINSIGVHLENFAKKEESGLTGQGKEAIKTRIEDAMKILKDPPI